jgi:hypothetical protein
MTISVSEYCLSMAEAYKYDKLPVGSFRHLTLFAGTHENPIHCKLSPTSLDTQRLPDYEALCYEWNPPTSDVDIYTKSTKVANHQQSQPPNTDLQRLTEVPSTLQIRENCKDALLHL